VEGKAVRERRWPPPSYVGPRNVRVLTLQDPTTIWLWEYLYVIKPVCYITVCYNLYVIKMKKICNSFILCCLSKNKVRSTYLLELLIIRCHKPKND